jgi:PAS domain S-box-containing protein
MVEASPNALVLANQNGKIAYINNYAEKLFMYSKSEIIGQNLEILIPQKFKAHHPNFVKGYLKNPLSRQMGANRELFAIKKDGTEFPVEIGLNPIVTVDGTLVLASIIDISERVKANHEKQKAAEQFRLVVESAPNAIILVDKSGEITLVNKQTELLFNYSRDELIGKNVESLLPEEFRKNHPELREMFFTNPQSRPMGVGRDLFAVRKDGSEFPIEIGLSPLKMHNDISVLTSIIDITERKKLEETQKLHLQKIEDKNKELEQFAYIASHDLRAPLQSISSFTQLLLEEKSNILDKDGIDSLNYISDSTIRMSALISGILDYGRIGKTAKIKEVNLNKVLRNACDDLSYIINESDSQIETDDMPTILAYETEIRLLFQNLIANAIKFRKPGIAPKIHVKAEQLENLWKFSVSDNGIGIPPEHKDKIFVLFQRLDNSKDYEGTGIGLAHCRKIAELHNGEIGVESEVDTGSTFYFTINTNLQKI